MNLRDCIRTSHKETRRPVRVSPRVDFSSTSAIQEQAMAFELSIVRELVLSSKVHATQEALQDEEYRNLLYRHLDDNLVNFVYGNLRKEILTAIDEELYSKLNYDEYRSLQEKLSNIFEEYS